MPKPEMIFTLAPEGGKLLVTLHVGDGTKRISEHFTVTDAVHWANAILVGQYGVERPKPGTWYVPRGAAYRMVNDVRLPEPVLPSYGEAVKALNALGINAQYGDTISLYAANGYFKPHVVVKNEARGQSKTRDLAE